MFKKLNISISIILLLLLIFYFILSIINTNNTDNPDNPIVPSLIINNENITLLVSDTDESRMLGLSNRDGLNGNEAMLFIFNNPDNHGIWMKDMKFAIDIIWIDENKRIIHLEENIEPNTYPKVFKSIEKSLYILETNAGFINKNKIKVGNILNLTHL